MLTARIKIGDDQIRDTQYYGLVYVSSDSRFAPDSKDFDVTTYPEQEGENVNPKTVDAPFDYKIKFYVKAEGKLENANQKIKAFNELLYDKGSDGIKTYKQVYLYNDYKKVLIVGYPKPIATPTQFWRDHTGETHDVVVVEWTIRVVKPSLCDFNL